MTRDAGEPAAVTDEEGSFVLGGLKPGPYAVRFEPPTGRVPTAGVGGAVSVVSGRATVVPDFGAVTSAAPSQPVPVLATRDARLAAAGVGGNGLVISFNPGAPTTTFQAFPGYLGAVSVARGDVNGDGTPDVIVGTLAGTTHVKVFDGATGALLMSFLAFDGYTGGVNVGSGDIDGDGKADVLVGAGPGAVGGHVKVYGGATGALVRSFLAFADLPDGVTVAGGDVDGDGRADIIVGTASLDARVKVFDAATGATVQNYRPFAGYSGGVSVAGSARGVVVGAAGFGPPHVKEFDAAGNEIDSFLAFDPGFHGGVFVG